MRSVSTDVSVRDRADSTAYLGYQSRDSLEGLQVSTTTPRATSNRPAALGSKFLSSLSNSQPAAAALSRKGSLLHSRAKSLAGFIPNLSARGGTTPSHERPRTTHERIGALFTGESAPIRLGAPISPTKEREESELIMDYVTTFTERPFARLRKAHTMPLDPVSIPTPIASTDTTVTTSVTSKSATSWLSRKTNITAPSSQQQQPAQTSRDEFADLDVNTALFPNGPTDPLDPAAYNELLLTATTLLLRMQAAYKEKVDYIASIRPEAEAREDELEGAKTCAAHLKIQLEDMSRRAQDQGATMKEMAAELAAEKIKAFEAQQALEASKTIRVVPAASYLNKIGTSGRSDIVRRRRGSSDGGTSDSGFESDMESVSGYSIPSTPVFTPTLLRMPSLDSSSIESGRPQSEHTTSQNKLKPMLLSTGNNGNGDRITQRLEREKAAWATVEVLRTENRDLKVRVKEIENTLQGCIELVSLVDAR